MGLLRRRRHGFVPAAATVTYGFSLVASGLCLGGAATWEVLPALSTAGWKKATARWEEITDAWKGFWKGQHDGWRQQRHG